MAGADLPTVMIALDKYDFMILIQVLELAQKKYANFWSSDEAADLASIHARLTEASKELPPVAERAMFLGDL